MTNQEKNHLLIQFLKGMVGASVLGTDIKNAHAIPVEIEFLQGTNGVQISFVVSHHFIGKCGSAAESLWALLDELEKQNDYSYPD